LLAAPAGESLVCSSIATDSERIDESMKQQTSITRRAMIGRAMAFAVGTTPLRGATSVLFPATDDIYRRSVVLDTLTYAKTTFDPGTLLAAGVTGGVFDLESEPRDRANAIRELDRWNIAFAAKGSLLYCVLKASDFEEAKRQGKLAIVLDSQDANVLGVPTYANGDENIETLRLLYSKGLRVLQLTYTGNNGLGSGYSESYDGGLARLGVAVVHEMNRLGMLIDVSHSSEHTTLESIALSTRPVAVTHSGCYSLYPDKRNKSDLVIRKLAEKGGYMGVYNMTMWMTTNPTSSVETIVDHIGHVVNVGGIDLAGFGSDQEALGDHRPQAEKVQSMQEFVDRNKGFPGGEPMHGHVTANDLDGVDRLHVIADALARRSYSSAAIEKVLGANFVRTFGAACG
jgi:membrane dipeptidase